MICKKCGNTLHDDDVKCSFCGALVEKDSTSKVNYSSETHSIQSITSSGDEYIFCSKCGEKNNKNYEFCQKCHSVLLKPNNTNNPQSYTNFNTYSAPTNYNYNQNNTPVLEFSSNRKKSIITICLYFGIFYIGGIIISLLCLLFASENLANLLTNIFVYIILIVTVIIILKDNLLTDLRNSKGIFWKYFGITFGLMFAASIGSSLILTIISSISGLDIGSSENQEGINEMFAMGGFATVSMIFITVIVAPIVEESVFRKSFFGVAKKPDLLTVFISALCFGAIHVVPAVIVLLASGNTADVIISEFLTLINYFALGFVLSFSYYRSRNIVPVIAAHAAWNLLASILSLLLVS